MNLLLLAAITAPVWVIGILIALDRHTARTNPGVDFGEKG